MNDDVRAYNRQGITLAQQGRLAEAAACFEHALRLDPKYAQGYNNLANVYLFQGRYAEAITNYHKSLELLPDDPEAYNNLSNALRKQGRLDDAAACCRQALWLRPNFAEAHSNLGLALELHGNLTEAEACYHAALKLRPEFPDALNNLCNLLRELGRLDEAITAGERALQFKPHFAEAYTNLGAAYLALNKLDQARVHCERAIQLNPNMAEAHCNLANVYWRTGQFAKAVAASNESLRLKPDMIEVENVLGAVAMKEGRFEEAVGCFDRLLRVKPDNAKAHFNRAIVRLLLGNFAEGWPEYEWRWQCTDFVVQPFRKPMWNGSSVVGKTVVLTSEQGLGDTIHFIRYAPLVKERGATVVVVCQEPLLKLLGRCPGVDRIIGRDTNFDAFDEHIPLLSLPDILKTTLETIPAPIPYVFAEPTLVENWRRELSAYPGFKIGIAWRGSSSHPDDYYRSIPLEQFAPLATVPGTHLFSLQKGPGIDQLTTATFAVTDLGQRLDETTGAFMDTAAVIMCLDLVITSDTAIAHLAGALGVPVWVALPSTPDWRWMLKREDSPWYPTMRLFRQNQRGDWHDVFERMTRELAKRLDARPTIESVRIEVTPGELIDKITILQIKRQRITDAAKLRHIELELEMLTASRDRFVPLTEDILHLTSELRAVNESLWDIEDEIRVCEKAQDFGPRFIHLARSVYRQNDNRAALKRQINDRLGAKWNEEKSYADYV